MLSVDISEQRGGKMSRTQTKIPLLFSGTCVCEWTLIAGISTARVWGGGKQKSLERGPPVASRPRHALWPWGEPVR